MDRSHDAGETFIPEWDQYSRAHDWHEVSQLVGKHHVQWDWQGNIAK
jgi:hypothetical protein